MRIIIAFLCLIIVVFFLFFAFLFYPNMGASYTYPNGATFALAICDDTDGATLENIKPVYDYLNKMGVASTKTVWMLNASKGEHGYSLGETLEDDAYRDYVLELQSRGVEIASHGARGASTERRQLEMGLKLFKSIFGYLPAIHINHSQNKDNLYWGKGRMSFDFLQSLYGLVISETEFSGDRSKSPYFWGDFAKLRLKYVRDFSFHEINLAKLPGINPYYDPEKPLVNAWFHTSDGHDVDAFNKLLSSENLDQLQVEGGYSIVYTHFGRGFFGENGLNDEFKVRIEDLMSRPVWVTTTSKLLEFLSGQHGTIESSAWQILRLQLRWTIEKFIYGRS